MRLKTFFQYSNITVEKTSWLVCAMLFAFCFSAQAQQTGKVFRIGYLDSSTASASAVLVEAFQQELSKLG
ncbi:MAG: hypothetical protein WAV47_02420, partial [Blastocatellia bacterium]